MVFLAVLGSVKADLGASCSVRLLIDPSSSWQASGLWCDTESFFHLPAPHLHICLHLLLIPELPALIPLLFRYSPVNVFVRNTGATLIPYKWNFTVYNPNWQTITLSWNFKVAAHWVSKSDITQFEGSMLFLDSSIEFPGHV